MSPGIAAYLLSRSLAPRRNQDGVSKHKDSGRSQNVLIFTTQPLHTQAHTMFIDIPSDNGYPINGIIYVLPVSHDLVTVKETDSEVRISFF
jgi:hypothetical protein